MKLVLASDNKGKLNEYKNLLGEINMTLLLKSEVGVSKNVKEDGKTFRENAYKKALAVFNACKIPTIADDSGLVVPALGGNPGVKSARYASKTGENASDEENIRKLLREMNKIEKKDAKFVCAICLVDKEGAHFFEGECQGRIASKPCGENGFGYDPIFLYKGKSFASIESRLKNEVSHRAKATSKLKEYLAMQGLNYKHKEE